MDPGEAAEVLPEPEMPMEQGKMGVATDDRGEEGAGLIIYSKYSTLSNIFCVAIVFFVASYYVVVKRDKKKHMRKSCSYFTAIYKGVRPFVVRCVVNVCGAGTGGGADGEAEEVEMVTAQDDTAEEVLPPHATDAPPPETTEAPPPETAEAPPPETTEAPPPETTEAPPPETTEAPPPERTDTLPLDTKSTSPREMTDITPPETAAVPQEPPPAGEWGVLPMLLITQFITWLSALITSYRAASDFVFHLYSVLLNDFALKYFDGFLHCLLIQ